MATSEINPATSWACFQEARASSDFKAAYWIWIGPNTLPPKRAACIEQVMKQLKDAGFTTFFLLSDQPSQQPWCYDRNIHWIDCTSALEGAPITSKVNHYRRTLPPHFAAISDLARYYLSNLLYLDCDIESVRCDQFPSFRKAVRLAGAEGKIMISPKFKATNDVTYFGRAASVEALETVERRWLRKQDDALSSYPTIKHVKETYEITGPSLTKELSEDLPGRGFAVFSYESHEVFYDGSWTVAQRELITDEELTDRLVMQMSLDLKRNPEIFDLSRFNFFLEKAENCAAVTDAVIERLHVDTFKHVFVKDVETYRRLKGSNPATMEELERALFMKFEDMITHLEEHLIPGLPSEVPA
ncbi:MAG: hypothetical protein SP1CHLAM54_14530 [Chlamydiia bacterium]|nr:hypothetical protein [Chlamydiia bacterium]MCH9616344.1 hypothetical protein [Chlamydiia bacterium]MCH9629670.1 hypothetical protein [Chlamydiia bacterium]